MGMINVGIVGCGRIADLHFPGYKDSKDARIYAVCDLDSKILLSRKEEWGANVAYSRWEDMLQDKAVDAVEILTPQPLHKRMVIEAAQAGKHIAVQKPMANDLASADQMLAAVQKANVVFKITENYVFYPPLVDARKRIQNGDIGTPVSLRIKFIGGNSGGWNIPSEAWEWRLKERSQGRGMVTFDHGHHLYSTAWYLLGDIERVVGWIDSIDGILDSPAMFLWKYQNSKAYGSCDFSYATEMHIPSLYYANDEWIEITGTKGLLFIRRCTGNIHSGPVLFHFNGQEMKEIFLPSDWQEGFKGATHNFIHAIQGKEKPLLSGEEGRNILRFSLACQKSAQIRREVYPEEMDSSWPLFYHWNRRRQEKKEQTGGCFSWLHRSDAAYAPQARFLTERLIQRFQPEMAGDWKVEIGLCLLPEGTTQEQKFSLKIQDKKIELQIGELPANPNVILSIPAGTWAAILLGKKKIESALLLGQIKIQGKAEDALPLRKVFDI